MRWTSNRMWLGLWLWVACHALDVEGRRFAPYAAAVGFRGGADVPSSSVVIPVETTEIPTSPVLPITQPSESSKLPSKWANVGERTLPAILLLLGLSAWVRFLGNKGVVALVFLIQVLLYSEVTSVVDVQGWNKWWWFLTYCLGMSGRALLLESSEGLATVELVSFGMAVLSMCGFVVQMNSPGSGPETFRTNLGYMAASHLALLVLVGQTSFWISTVQEFGLLWILYPAFLVIINDTMAYVFGMIWGKHALLPVISPKKTWEGFAGATLSTMALASPLLRLMSKNSYLPSPVQHALVLSTYVSLVAPFGGFFASITKRAYGKKDFGSLIPGHGGIVDRLDCQVVTAPFVYLYLKHFL